MSAHRPAPLPLHARIKPTLNMPSSARGVVVEQNRIARRVVDCLHKRILDNPDKHQHYSHEDVGAALGVDARKVRLSLAHAGLTGITVEVTTKSRAAIKEALRETAQIRPRGTRK